jgi:predicted Fe-Mo cluster-binding NifX family protein
MKIAISAGGTDLSAEMDPRFGRCRCFIIADPETGEFEAVDNSGAASSGAAGIAAAQLVAGKGVNLVLTGNCGPNAYNTLSAAGINVITGLSGKIADIIENYRTGSLKAAAAANVPGHFGMNTAAGWGFKTAPGAGSGRGRGGGHGMCGGGISRYAQSPDLETLKAQSKMVAQQLAEIQEKISALETRRD